MPALIELSSLSMDAAPAVSIVEKESIPVPPFLSPNKPSLTKPTISGLRAATIAKSIELIKSAHDHLIDGVKANNVGDLLQAIMDAHQATVLAGAAWKKRPKLAARIIRTARKIMVMAKLGTDEIDPPDALDDLSKLAMMKLRWSSPPMHPEAIQQIREEEAGRPFISTSNIWEAMKVSQMLKSRGIAAVPRRRGGESGLVVFNPAQAPFATQFIRSLKPPTEQEYPVVPIDPAISYRWPGSTQQGLGQADPDLGRLVEYLVGQPPGSSLFELGLALGWLGETQKAAVTANRPDIGRVAEVMLKAAKIKALAKIFGI